MSNEPGASGETPRGGQTLTAAEEILVQRLGIHYEREGLPRIAGQVFALLLLSEPPLTLDDLAETLRVSKGSASTNVRLLERMGAARRVSRSGDRRDWWQVREDLTRARFRVAVQGIQDMQDVLEEVLPPLREEGGEGIRRLEALHAFHAFLLEELEGVMQRWEERSEGPAGGRMSESRRVT